MTIVVPGDGGGGGGITPPAGDIGGSTSDPIVTGIQGVPVSATPPDDGDVIAYNATDGEYEPTAVSGTGTVTSVGVAAANGFNGTVADDTTTPVITIECTITGLLKSNGTAVSAATANTDYLPVNNAAMTGTPTVPTASPGTNTTQAASTAFVTAAVAASPAGTVTSVSVVTANGFAGTVATSTTTPAITITTSITGLLKGNGTAISAATANTDYLPVNNAAMTGTPTVPTASPGTNTTQAASTAFVQAAANPFPTAPQAGELSVPVTNGAGVFADVMATGSLAVGVWLIIASFLVEGGSGSSQQAYQTVVGTATATFAGKSSGEVPTAPGVLGNVTLAFLATVTVAGTIKFQGQDSNSNGGANQSAIPVGTVAGATGWTATRVQ